MFSLLSPQQMMAAYAAIVLLGTVGVFFRICGIRF